MPSCRAPVTGWIVNVPVQAGGRPPGACRNVRRDDGGGGAPAGSAGSRISLNGMPLRDARRDDRPSQPPDKSLPLVPGQRRPAVRVRVETGLWRAALRMRGGAWACQRPWRSRIVNARPSPCRTMPPAADRCPCPGGGQAARDSPVGCGHHPAKFGPARNLRHPACHRFESGACTPNPLPNGTACARPSGLSFPKLRRRGARRVFVRRSRAEPDHPFRRYSLS
jgi:hypothetical protein